MVHGNRGIDHVMTHPLSRTVKQAWRRSQYFRAWAKARGIVWDNVTAGVAITELRSWPVACFLKARVKEQFVSTPSTPESAPGLAWASLTGMPWTERPKAGKSPKTSDPVASIPLPANL